MPDTSPLPRHDAGADDARRIAVLGATGSIGTSALDVIARHRGWMRASVLAAGSNVQALIALCQAHRPEHAAIADPALYIPLRDGLRDASLATEAHAGAEAIDALAAGPDCDTVVAAVVGAAGLSSTLAAARAGKRLLLANKEALVLAGELLTREAAAAGAEIIPIDSEHSAIFQCLRSRDASVAGAGVRRLVLTASGGPFRGRSRADLQAVTPAQAVAHPKWSMGPKISVDSATLMNKGLEVIEAHHLFDVPGARIDVLVHPQSLVHSLVEYVDGSTLAQLGLPDMRTTLAVGLGWPRRIESGVAGLDLLAHGRLEFEAPDLDAFPCLRLAWQALEAGGSAPAILNAANEIAVSAFLQGRIGFLSIPELVEQALSALPDTAADTLEALLAADARCRQITTTAIARLPHA
ncbi:1-deoxy-D-xylulose-5-phosphate reductoisomerase [Stenotrophomonas mori]|uniref:1-deoxy-D-xylulose 5-phosphate reductoisomerase n=1 Tax=Stenotrophomonas mori TaxID=2871096 RepID=A0ABT0SG41_9GAMM|nr:1-deoxy-D-xylulose-5-phosphate reductoisomerase [Stenotrophomonas mori]MCL7714295.1 1-deoxy-D-xylulose-5-phosphate reductoisomerase [Stenotrophomonas mori]